MTTMIMLFWDLHTAVDDDDRGGDDDDDDDDDDNDNDDNYDDDGDMLLWDLHTVLVAPDRPSTAKTLTDDCSALYWTQELGPICLESGRRAASNEPSCFSRR